MFFLNNLFITSTLIVGAGSVLTTLTGMATPFGYDVTDNVMRCCRLYFVRAWGSTDRLCTYCILYQAVISCLLVFEVVDHIPGLTLYQDRHFNKCCSLGKMEGRTVPVTTLPNFNKKGG
jgi:hypothetical protein